MKRLRSHSSFIENLRRQMKSLKKMGREDVHVFSIDAQFGHYQIVIGPQLGHKKRRLEIDGKIHHLFVSPKAISANPSRRQIRANLKNTVIVRDLSVHLCDPCGDGNSLLINKSDAQPREYINLAGKNGESLVEKIEANGRLSRAAYRIIQKDILHSLKKEERK